VLGHRRRHPGQPVELEKYVAAYAEITGQEPMSQIFIAPFEPLVMEKLIWPLRQAKANYVAGNYVATIALCGLVGEMVTILLMEMHLQRTLSGAALEKAIASFEEAGQAARINKLTKAQAVTAPQTSRLSLIREKRNKYLHAFSRPHDDPKKDARTLFVAAAKMVAETITAPPVFREGKLVLNPHFTEYLRKRIPLTPVDPEPEKENQSD